MEATGKTPFRHVYGSEAVLSAEIGVQSYRVEFFNQEANNQARGEELDSLEERRLGAAKTMARAREFAATYFNRKVKARQLGILGHSKE